MKYSGGFTDGQPHSRQTKAYHAAYRANTGVLMLQMESVESAINVCPLCLPGVGCLSWRPNPDSNDLAFSRDQRPEIPLMARLERVAYTKEKVKNTQVKVGMRSLGRENREM